MNNQSSTITRYKQHADACYLEEFSTDFPNVTFKSVTTTADGSPEKVIDLIPKILGDTNVERVPYEEYISIETHRIPLIYKANYFSTISAETLETLEQQEGQYIAIFNKSPLSGTIFGVEIYQIQQGKRTSLYSYRNTTKEEK